MLATARPHASLHTQPSLPRDGTAAITEMGRDNAHSRSSSGSGATDHHLFSSKPAEHNQNGIRPLPAVSEGTAQGEAYFGGLTEAEWKLVMLAGTGKSGTSQIQAMMC